MLPGGAKRRGRTARFFPALCNVRNLLIQVSVGFVSVSWILRTAQRNPSRLSLLAYDPFPVSLDAPSGLSVWKFNSGLKVWKFIRLEVCSEFGSFRFPLILRHAFGPSLGMSLFPLSLRVGSGIGLSPAGFASHEMWDFRYPCFFG